MKENAIYLETARGDHKKFADTKRSRYVVILLVLLIRWFLLCGEVGGGHWTGEW